MAKGKLIPVTKDDGLVLGYFHVFKHRRLEDTFVVTTVAADCSSIDMVVTGATLRKLAADIQEFVGGGLA